MPSSITRISNVYCLSILLGLPVQVHAEVSEREFTELQAQLARLAERVEYLEAELETARAERSQEDTAAPEERRTREGWSQNLELSGDFRYRYENIDVQDAASRERHRVRARARLVAHLPAGVDVGVGVASGDTDPVSSNQTLGDGGSTKDLRLDLAYLDWRPLSNVSLRAGKFPNPLHKPGGSGLLWDGDWRPEGLSASWQGGALFATLLGNWLESDSDQNNARFTWGLQGGVELSRGGISLVASASYFDIPVAGDRPFYSGEFSGNSTKGGAYALDYRLVEAGAELALQAGKLPLGLYGDFVHNIEADRDHTGWLLGVRLGRVSATGDWEITYQYEGLEADAALGLLTDSDFAGGGTGGRGHRFTGALGLTEKWRIGFTWLFDNEQAAGVGYRDYDRLMLDTQLDL